jgi:transcriptional regulator with XRE-family HTH domain
MKPDLPAWVSRLAAAKKAAKEAGLIKGDADLSAAISETLQPDGKEKINRAAINHWLNGVRQPNVQQFLALCAALKVSPAKILGEDPCTVINFQAREPDPPPWSPLPPDLEQIITDIRCAEPAARQMALAVAKTALEKSPHQPKAKKAS